MSGGFRRRVGDLMHRGSSGSYEGLVDSQAIEAELANFTQLVERYEQHVYYPNPADPQREQSTRRDLSKRCNKSKSKLKRLMRVDNVSHDLKDRYDRQNGRFKDANEVVLQADLRMQGLL